jgi:hypothetical protein
VALSTVLWVLLPFLILRVKNKKLSLLTSILLLPSIIINDQVSYLNSFYAHYQSDFFAIVVAFSAVCLVDALRLRIKIPLTAGILLIWIFTFTVYEQSVYSKFSQPQLSYSAASSKFMQEVTNSLGLYFLPNSSEQIKMYIENKRKENIFFQNVASPVKDLREFISAPEEFMPALIGVGAVHVDYFPVGVGKDKYVIAPYTELNSKLPDVSIYGVVPVVFRGKWSSCIQSILEDKYYIKKLQTVNGRKAILFERK